MTDRTPNAPLGEVPRWLNLDALDLDEAVGDRIRELVEIGNDLVPSVLKFLDMASAAMRAADDANRGFDEYEDVLAVVWAYTGQKRLFDMCQVIADAGMDVTGSVADSAQRKMLREQLGFGTAA